MSDSPVVGVLLNGILIGTSGWCFYKIAPADHPYAFAACVLGFCHGVLGLFHICHGGGDDDSCGKLKEASTGVMEIVPLPLVNVELYLKTGQNNIALGHGLFIVPLAVHIIMHMFKEAGGEEDPCETLKHLTILGNCTSLLYLALNEGNWLYGGMAITAFLTKYGAMFIDNSFEGTGKDITLFGHSGFFYLTSEAVAGEG